MRASAAFERQPVARCARRSGRAASPSGRADQDRLQLRRRSRSGEKRSAERRRACGEPHAQLVVGEEAADRRGQRLRVAGRRRAGRSRRARRSRDTPPTSVAIAGVPTASASTSVCGKFSHAEERSAASARRKSASTSSRESGPRKRTRPSRPSSRHAPRAPPARRRRRRARGRPPAPRATASSATPSAFGAVSRPANASSGRSAWARAGSSGSGGVGFGSTEIRSAGTPQPRTMLARGTRSGRRRAQRGAARRRAQRAAPAPSRLDWNSTGSPLNCPRLSARSNAGVLRQLGDERLPGQGGRERRAARASRWSRRRRSRARARRINLARAASAARRPRGDEAPRARGTSRGGAARRRSSRPRPRARAPSRNSATSGAWLAGPPTSGGQIPETIRTFTGRPTWAGRRVTHPRSAGSCSGAGTRSRS